MAAGHRLAADGTNHTHHTNGNGGSHGHSGSADASRGAASPTPTTPSTGIRSASACKWADKITSAARRRATSRASGAAAARRRLSPPASRTRPRSAAIGAAWADGVDHPTCLEATGEHGEARVAAATAWLDGATAAAVGGARFAAWHSDWQRRTPLLQERLDVAKAVGEAQDVARRAWPQNKAVGDERGGQIVHAAGEWIKQVAAARARR